MTSETRLEHTENHASSLVGTLDSWPVPDLLVWLHQTQRTAMVRIGAGLDAGIIFFSHGELYRCEWGQLTGEQALYHLLQVKAGTFTLIQREFPQAAPNVHRSTPEVLLQSAVLIDERHRERVA